MASVLEFGIIPNDPARAVQNSAALERMRESCLHIEWTHVPRGDEFCLYSLERGVWLRKGERWSGASAYTQLYFASVHHETGALLAMGDRAKVDDLSLVNKGAHGQGKKIGVGLTDGRPHPNHADNGQRWTVTNVSVQFCADAVRLHDVWIASMRDCVFSNCVNGVHVTGQAIQLHMSGGEIGGNNDGYGVLLANGAFDCRFESVAIEGNAKGGVLHAGVGGKRNVTYDNCYFEGNGYYGNTGSKATNQARHIVIDSIRDVGTKILNCGFHDPLVPGYEIRRALGTRLRGNYHSTAVGGAGYHGRIGPEARHATVERGTCGATMNYAPGLEVIEHAAA